MSSITADESNDIGTRFSWPASLVIGVFVVGVAGVLDTAPFWAACCGVAGASIAHSAPSETPARLQRWMRTDSEKWERHPRVLVVGGFLLIPFALTAAWPQAQPTDLWSPWALVYGVAVGVFFYAHALRRGSSGRPARWWWAWLPLASIVILFFAVGGPFRVRWAYCESRLTAAVTAGELVDIPTTGRFCWHDAVERTVDGERGLYISGADDGDGSGFVYSPSGAIKGVAGIELLRNLGHGWYYFEEGSPERDFWFDG